MPPVSQSQRRWAWANKDKKTKEGRAAAEYAAADPGGKLPEKVMNPVMHTHHPMENEVKREAPKAKTRKGPFTAKRGEFHSLFNARGGEPNATERMQGGPETEEGDRASQEYEANEIGIEHQPNNLGSERIKGHGEPKGGTSTLPGGLDGRPKMGGFDHGPDGVRRPEGTTGSLGAQRHDGVEELNDETRGTHALPPSEYSGGRKVPQEVKERLAKALTHRR